MKYGAHLENSAQLALTGVHVLPEFVAEIDKDDSG